MPIARVQFPSVHDFWNLRRKHETGNYRIVQQGNPCIIELFDLSVCQNVLHEYDGVLEKKVVTAVEVAEV